MKKLTTTEVKEIELKMLNSFHQFCEENNLTYYLAYGTLLGAVRHKGFIPWDDDIDIYMIRKDYEYVINNFNKKIKDETIGVISIKQNDKFYVPFAKIINNKTFVSEKVTEKCPIGVWIDIFPLDNMSSKYKKALLLIKKVRFFKILNLIKVYTFKGRAKNFYEFLEKTICKLVKKIIFFIKNKDIITKIDKLSQKYNNEENSKYIGYVAEFIGNNIMQKEWFKERVLLDFEGYKFWCPKEYDKVLKFCFGDYMKLPPENKRVHHSVEAYWKD